MKTLDVRGEICPYPMMRAVDALKSLEDPEGLIVLTDHPPALGTIPWEAAKLGYEADIEPSGGAEWRIHLRSSERQRSPQEVLAELSQQLQTLGVGG